MRSMTLLVTCLLVLTPAVAQDPAEEAQDAALAAAEEAAWATYRLKVEGAWPQPPGAMRTLVVAWAPGPQLRDMDGTWTDTLAAVWLGPDLDVDESAWAPGSGARHYRPDGSLLGFARAGAWNVTSGADDVAEVPRTGNPRVDGAAADAMDDGRRTADDVHPVEEAETGVRQMYEYIERGKHDCFLRPPLEAHLVCRVPGLEPLGAVGPLQQERTADGLLHAWGGDPTTRIDILYEDGLPFARHLEVRHMTAQGLARAVLDLADWEGLPEAAGDAPDEPLEPPLIHHGERGLPPEAGLEHPFRLTDAVRLLLDQTSVRRADGEGEDFTSWYTTATQPYIHYASFRQDVTDGGAADFAWLLGWTDGHEAMFVQAVRDGDPPDVPSQLLGEDNLTFTVVDQPADALGHLVPIWKVPRHLPDVADIMRWWRAYADGWEGVEPNAYGFQVLCDDCRDAEMRLWAGVHTSEVVTEGNATNSSTERVTRYSALYMDAAGRAVAYEERDTEGSTAQWFQVPPGLVPEDPGGILPDDLRDVLGDPFVADPVAWDKPVSGASAAADAGTDVDERTTPLAAAAWSVLCLLALAGVHLRRVRRV